jgi:CheY-like chemotaxis protein
MDPGSRMNFAAACALVLDGSVNGAEISAQILKGFGVGQILRCESQEEALRRLDRDKVDLVLVDRDLKEHDGCDFIAQLRRTGVDGNAAAPVILTMGQVRGSDLNRARNCGASFVLSKPFSSDTLLKRIVWLKLTPREFIKASSYSGPDRRFRFAGPPPGSTGRRATDKAGALGAPVAPNLSQAEIDGMFKANKVSL